MIDTFLKLHAAYENKAQRILLKEFRKIGRRISFNVLTPENAPVIVGLAVNEKEIEKALFKVHYTIGKSYGNLEARRLRREIKRFKPLPLFNEAFQAFLLEYYANFGGEYITLLTETYVEEIIKEISRATIENETVIQMRDRIFRTVNRPDFYRWQALRIARTETTFAMNRAKMIGAETSGLVTEKVWFTYNDSKVRDSHIAMHGKTVDADKPFSVGGEKMDHPGDKLNGASAANLVNCRCTFSIRSKRDANGNLQFRD